MSQTAVVCAQLAPVLGDVTGNRARAIEAIDAAAARGAGLVVLPELCNSGYAFADIAEARGLAEPARGPTVSAWHARAAAHDLVVIGGLCELDEDGLVRNSAAVVDASGLRAVYRKTHLWDREQLLFTAGEVPPPVIETDFGRVGVAICYDAVFPELMRGLARDGADLIAIPMNSPTQARSRRPVTIEIVLAIATAHVNRVFVAQADRAGHERGIDWAQASVILDPDGRLLAGPQDGVGLLLADCDLARARDKSLSARNDAFGDRREDLYLAPARPHGPAKPQPGRPWHDQTRTM